MNTIGNPLVEQLQTAPCGEAMLANVPNPQVIPQARPVIIKKVANGFVLEIGCSTFVAKSWSEAATGLGEYFTDPVAAEKKYRTA